MIITKRIAYCAALGGLLLAGPAGAQTGEGEGGLEAAPAEGRLPRSFRGAALGMGLEDLKSALAGDGLFQFRGDRDVSFLPREEQSLVETTGLSYIRRAFFQLRKGEVFIMAFSLDPALIDHYSVFTDFVKKYGPPQRLDPGQAVWENAETRIALERPLTVKYIDRALFAEIIGEASVKESGEVFAREEFLRGF